MALLTFAGGQFHRVIPVARSGPGELHFYRRTVTLLWRAPCRTNAHFMCNHTQIKHLTRESSVATPRALSPPEVPISRVHGVAADGCESVVAMRHPQSSQGQRPERCLLSPRYGLARQRPLSPKHH